MSLYQDKPSFNNLSNHDQAILQKVQQLHEDLNHASADAMIRTVRGEDKNRLPKGARLGVSVAELEIWKKYRGDQCRGCIRGKMTEHPHKLTSREDTYQPGEVVAGDLMFLELKEGQATKPLLVTIDLATQLSIVTTLKDKSSEAVYEGLAVDQSIKRGYGKPIKTLLFDREPRSDCTIFSTQARARYHIRG